MPCDVNSAERTEAKPTEDEAALLERIRNGESELFYELVQPHERTVYLSAYAILQHEADAEEVAQEAVLKAFSNLHQFRGEAKFSTWLVRIAINEARIRVRRNRLRAAESLDEPAGNDNEGDYTPHFLADWGEIPSEALERAEVRHMLEQALNSLSQAHREVVMLRDVQQLSTAETAEILGITQASVKTRLLRARLQLRDRLSQVLGEDYRTSQWLQKGRKPWAW